MEVLVQALLRGVPFPTPVSDAARRYVPTEFGMEVKVSESSGPDGHIKSMVADIRGVPRSEVDNLAGNAIVQVNAGYRETFGVKSERLAVSPVFVGTLDVAYNARRGGSNVLHIEASLSPPQWRELFVPINVAGGTATIGSVMQLLGAKAGIKVEVSAASTGHVLQNGKAVLSQRLKNMVTLGHSYNSLYPPLTEIEFLARELSDVSGHEHHVDVTADGGTVRVIDLTHPQTEVVVIPIDSPFVRNASPVVVRGGTQATSLDTAIDASSLAYSLSSGLHPAIAAGVIVEVEPDGRFTATSVEHTMGSEYETQSYGPFQYGKGAEVG